MPQLPRSAVYIDGLNLYKRVLAGRPNKWLDLEGYFTCLRPLERVVRIRYFTSLVVADGTGGRARQGTYLGALRAHSSPRLRIHHGKHKKRSVRCQVAECQYAGDRRFGTWVEKFTDVALAVWLTEEAFRDEFDVAVIVSGDTDLCPALERLRANHHNKRVVLYVPTHQSPKRSSLALRKLADESWNLPLGKLHSHQLPMSVPRRDGTAVYTRPHEWA
ncbi:NYN domain-containing protein [bacterium]|nr:NYN domain-containing protein [bacterium]